MFFLIIILKNLKFIYYTNYFIKFITIFVLLWFMYIIIFILGVALIEIDNPDSRNALSSLMIENVNKIIF